MSPSTRRLSMRFAFLDMFLWTLLQPRPVRKPDGLGSAPFDRLYSGYRCFFLFLRVLRCFSSPRSPHVLHGDRSSTCRVAPFGCLRINVCLQLPVAFRSLPRPSSPPDSLGILRSLFSSFSRESLSLYRQSSDRRRLRFVSFLPMKLQSLIRNSKKLSNY